MDFEKISASIRIHFCPECKASFGCEVDEDGDCDCEGYKYNWSRPWCPNCVEQKNLERCTCEFRYGSVQTHYSYCASYKNVEE